MICDVVVCFFRKLHLWPLVAHGLALNQDHIGTVWISNDERWDEEMRYRMAKVVNNRFDAVYLWHEHDGFGHHKSLNQGAHKVRTPYFVHMDDDIILQPDCVAKLLEDVDDSTLVGGVCHDVANDITLDQLKDGDYTILRQDKRQRFWPLPETRWIAVRDCLMCCSKQSYLDLGGRDETYGGYGFIDYDFGVRWMMKHGLESFIMGRGEALNVNGLEHPHEYTKDNLKKFCAKAEEWIEYLRREEPHLKIDKRFIPIAQ